MVQYHKQPKTKASGTGGKKRSNRDKILAHFGGFFSRTHFNKEAKEEKRETRRVKGGAAKQAGKLVLFATVASKGSVKKAKILNVAQSPDNPHHSRENIITRGAIIETDLGKARVTSRPGQHGVVNAVLIEEKGKAPHAAGHATHAAPHHAPAKAEAKAAPASA